MKTKIIGAETFTAICESAAREITGFAFEAEGRKWVVHDAMQAGFAWGEGLRISEPTSGFGFWPDPDEATYDWREAIELATAQLQRRGREKVEQAISAALDKPSQLNRNKEES